MDLTRSTPAPLSSALSGPFFYPVVLVWLDWPGAPLRMHSGAGDITWQGQTWTGAGKFGRVSVPDEAMAGVPEDFTISLVTDFPDIEPYTDAVIRGIPGAVYLGATTTPGGNSLIGATEVVSGTADVLTLGTEMDGDTLYYELSVAMTTGPGMRSMASINHSDEDQRRAYPADTAGERLIELVGRVKKTYWPEP